MNNFDWDVIARSWPFLAEGMSLSALLVAVATAGGLVLGFGLAMMRRSDKAWITGPATAYVTVMRCVPLILVLFWFYFLVPLVIGRPVGSLASALVAFVLFEAAFYCEIIRAGMDSVRPGQTEAALATGMRRWQVTRLVVLPQGLRAMTPLLLNQIIIVFQDTSLVYVVALRDFMTTASVVAARDGRPTEMYTLVAVVYLAICFSLSKSIDIFRNKGSAR
ncbi:MAG: amino acid ABC transporter permease [Ideonella sp.]